MMQTAPSHKLKASFGWLNAAQFFGALNDNVFKAFVVFFMIDLYGEKDALRESAVAMGLFVLPFLMFATLAGQFADRFSKQRIVLGVKVAEVVVMALGVLAFWLGSMPGLCVILFLMATQSAMFGPSKYGIIPELVDSTQLSRANAALTALSYLAIVLGSAAAPLLSGLADGRYALMSLGCLLVALAGLGCARGIKYTPPVAAERALSPFIVSDVWRTIRSIRTDRYLLLAILASAYFLLIAAFVQINLIPYGMEALGLDKTGAAYLFTITAVGIGLGALVAGKLSGDNVEFGVVPFGALGITVNAILLAICPPSLPLALVLIFLMGLSVGLFVVPLNAFIQYRTPKSRMGEVLAASSFLSWVGVLLAAVFLHALARFGMSARGGFLVVFGLTLVLTVVSVRVLPDFIVRFLGLLVTKVFYRVRVKGLKNYPSEGPALLVSNHVSFVDALLLGVVRARRIRFIMNRELFDNPRFNWLWRIMGVIPISFQDSPKQIVESFRQARKAMDEGFVVCIFAEGAITRTGVPRAFRPGFERILKGTDYPVIPVYLGGLWGSILSHFHGEIRPRWPLELPYRVTVSFETRSPRQPRPSRFERRSQNCPPSTTIR